jgi:Tfp pilus assembly pilus retraction ATPase PilT
MIVEELIPEKLKYRIKEVYDFDFSYELEHKSRFRVNMLYENSKMALSIRVVPYNIPDFENLKLLR